MGRTEEWFEERVGVSGLAETGNELLSKRVPSHINYAFTLGTAAITLFMTQVGSGILLALNYTASMEGAHESVWRITHEISSGWLIRSFHSWGAHMMVLVVLLHMLRVFWYGGYKKPRELTWVFGCILLFITLGFGFTGYLLPMSVVSYFGTTVATEPVVHLPFIGDMAQRALLGGEEIGDVTLSRFYILHVFLLPAAIVALIGAHLYLVRRLGISPKESVTEERAQGYEKMMKERGVIFSKHLYREMTTVIVVLSLVVILAVLFPVHLEAAADPMDTPPGVKPEWYFLPVYQFLKYVPKLFGLLVITLATVVLVALPFIDRNPERAPRKRKRMMFVATASLLATLMIGMAGYVSERTFWGVKFDIFAKPHFTAGPE